jgi:2-isopropylmalate synthase
LLGYHYEGEDLNTLYENFLLLADEKKEVKDEDLMVLAVNLPVLVK